MRVVLASQNAGKLREFSTLFEGVATLLTPAEVGLHLDIEESGASFAENAERKAQAFAEASKLPSLADDSGLCVDALQGRPGVHSARYASSDAERIARLLDELKGCPEGQRAAHFACVLCLAFPGGGVVFSEGVCHGRIAYAPRGPHGFGYDPLFELPTGKTMAELTREEKAEVSHRGLAARHMRAQMEVLGKP
ncbi:MAG: RdgB/HAM1 family non-canonical purine NTP pyrophosphatase [Proteobacteria bacterium]|nr:RdgB/HAM1 family non-canonical purine NTP pyrophosphatase [Cystobacterineae bacterium]MCL2259628.1 RdgB/HAM1 family non-canonical purine NTP pyrophosphatase [Cystobacterineae bacterium]MCL2313790.1 RdgB/HAM1 family non-canonical purine NTP pyrophosphatase [Pseudomonadota bacterium]